VTNPRLAAVASAGLAAVAIGVATPAFAASATTPPAANSQSGQGTVALPLGAPVALYPQDEIVGGDDPYTPFGTDPDGAYGVWPE
jgi:hypothetical protein